MTLGVGFNTPCYHRKERCEGGGCTFVGKLNSDGIKIDDIVEGFLQAHHSTRKLASTSNSWSIEEKDLATDLNDRK